MAELADSCLSKTRCSWLPSGTTVLLTAPGYLPGICLAAYLEELVFVTSQIRKALPQNCHIYHAPVLLLSGTEDPALVASLSELAHWLLATQTLDHDSCLLAKQHRPGSQMSFGWNAMNSPTTP